MKFTHSNSINITMNLLNTKTVATFTTLLLFLMLSSADNVSSAKGNGEANFNATQWCVADEQTPDDVLQKALDWACGPGGADCKDIQIGGPCYLPNTKKDHASYAFNSYWHKYKQHGATCSFNYAAMITESNPSHGTCRFESVA